MPYVNVQITREGNTREQKEAVIRGVTAVLVDVLGKDPETTFVVIEEVAFEDWGIGGVQVDTWRASRG
jgi:4-oxalocrotonate tautomerase